VGRPNQPQRATVLLAARAWFRRLAVTGGMTLATLGLAGLTALPAHAATQTLTVTTFGDPATSDCPAAASPCSLREAITVADGDTGDTIDLPAGTYTLANAAVLPDITTSMSVVGASAATTFIDGVTTLALSGATVTVEASGATVDFANLTIQDSDNGSTGDGGVDVIAGSTANTVSFTDVAIANNKAGNVGGLFNGGNNDTTLTDVTISGNQDTSDPYAAGVENYGTLTLVNVTVADNVGSGSGAAGGIDNTGTLTITNSDIVGNTGSGSETAGGIDPGPDPESDPVDIVNSIVSGNTDSTGSTNCYTAVTTTSHNIEDGTTCGFTGTGDQESTNPDLGSLASNGGPLETEALLTGSPAIQAALKSSCPTDDERGYVRITGSDTTCDIGAYEYGAAAPASTSVPVPESGAEGGSGSMLPWAAALLIAGLGLAIAARRRRSPDPAS